MSILLVLTYLMAAIGLVTTGFTLVAYWMIFMAAMNPGRGDE